MIKPFISFFVIIILNFSLTAQENPVALVGDKKITADEFRNRYELMPRLSDNYDLTDSLKYEFLFSLIAEKLWAMEADEQEYDTTEIIKYSLLPIEKIYVRDALFKEVIESKINITDAEINKALAKSRLTLKVNIISSPDSAEIYNIYSELLISPNTDSLIQLIAEQVDITFGELQDESIEDTLFSMLPGMISSPVKTKNGWFIFNMQEKIIASTGNQNQAMLRNIIKERKARKLGTEYLGELLKNITVTPDENLFWELVNKIEILFKEKESPEKTENFYLSESDVNRLIKIIPSPLLNKDFIFLENNNIKLKELVYYLSFSGFISKSSSKDEIAFRLNNLLKIFIENELITREGYRRGYHNLPEVKNELELWKENFLAQILRNRFIDSVQVSEEEVIEFYNNIYNDTIPVTHVNIIEILTSDLDIVKLVLDELKNGKDFKELALQFNERESTKKNGGEYGFFPVTMHGEIGEAAAKINVGDVYGPLKLQEGYSIFKLIDKKKSKTPPPVFDDVKEQLKNSLTAKKLKSIYENYTVKLAEKYNISIDHSLLESIKVSEVNMFTYHYMGFGGRITAVPYTSTWHEWRKIWEKREVLNP